MCMTKNYFLKNHRIRIGTCFNEEFFLSDKVLLSKKIVSVNELYGYFSPWYQKEGRIIKEFNIVRDDTNCKPIKIKEAWFYEEKAEEINKHRKEMCLNSKEEILLNLTTTPPIIAIDTSTEKTLVLDKNRTLNLLVEYDNDQELLPIIELVGTSLEDLCVDFLVINSR